MFRSFPIGSKVAALCILAAQQPDSCKKLQGKRGKLSTCCRFPILCLNVNIRFSNVMCLINWNDPSSLVPNDPTTARLRRCFLSSAPSRTSPAPRTPCPLWSFREADGMGRIIAGGSPRILSRLYPWLYESNNTENIGFDKKKKNKKKKNQSKQKNKQTRKPKPRKKTRKKQKKQKKLRKMQVLFFSCFLFLFCLFLLVFFPVDLFFWWFCFFC